MAFVLNQEMIDEVRRLIREDRARHGNNPPVDASGGRYERLPIRRFKLTAALALSGNAAAVFRYRDPSTGTIADSSETLTVYDAQGIFEGDSGAYGYCIQVIDGPTARWEVIQLGCG